MIHGSISRGQFGWLPASCVWKDMRERKAGICHFLPATKKRKNKLEEARESSLTYGKLSPRHSRGPMLGIHAQLGEDLVEKLLKARNIWFHHSG